MKKILIVDDEPTITILMAEILAATGDYRVEATNDPLHALRRAQSETFDLIISDWQMPGLNGDTLFRRLQNSFRKNPSRSAGLPHLLLMSGLTSEEKIRPMLDFIGSRSFLKKPFDIETLTNTVDDLVFGEPRCLAEEITRELDRLEMQAC